MQHKVLILTAIPRGLRLDQEIRDIDEAIQRAARRDKFEIRMRTAVRSQDIRRAIAEERPQIVHFCGHGLEAIRDQNITRAKAALERVRSIRRSRRSLGVDGICEHVKDVDGNWLENWTDEETTPETSIRRKKPLGV